jgi:signal transduction histidine kinase
MTREWSGTDIESLIEVSSLINSSLKIDEVLENSMRVVEELTDAEKSSIFEIDFEKNELYFRLAHGESNAKVNQVRMKMGEGIAGWVASSGETLFVPDTDKDTRFCKKVDDLTNFKSSSIIALPIKHKNRIIGVLEALNKRGPQTFDTKDEEVLTVLSNQIGIAIENAKLHARLQDKFAFTRSELKESQAKLIRAERMAALGQLAHGVAHTVRNPVASIGGFSRRLNKKLQLDDACSGYVDLIIKETARLEAIVKSVEEFTSIPEPRYRQCNFSSFIENTIREWKQSSNLINVKFEMDLLKEDPLVFVDDELMAKALMLVFNNAGEAMSEAGTIVVSTCREDSWMVISVKDSGAGIAHHDLPLVFDPFFTSKTYGAGLGLTTVSRIVNDHNGEVKIDSKSDTGTEVKIYFPAFPGGN